MTEKVITGYKGFNSDWTCINKQYKPGETYTEDKANLCHAGLHFVENPADLFNYYNPVGNNGKPNKFAIVTAEKVAEERSEDSKRVCEKLTIETELDFAGIVQARIQYAKDHTITGYTDPKLATAGDSGAATAGDSGAATAGDRGAATAGYRGVATAGDGGAATAGYGGAATAGCGGAATAGYGGAATAGDSGAATAKGSVCVGENGCALARGNNAKAKGGLGAILVLCEENDNDYDISVWKAFVVDGAEYKPDTWYRLLKDGTVKEA